MSDDEIKDEEPSKVRTLNVIHKDVRAIEGSKQILQQAIDNIDTDATQAVIVIRIKKNDAIQMTWSAGASNIEILGALQLAVRAVPSHLEP